MLLLIGCLMHISCGSAEDNIPLWLKNRVQIEIWPNVDPPVFHSVGESCTY